MPSPEDVLKRVFGYSNFRGSQKDVIAGALRGYDQIVVMATGGGKSLCYQIPPLVTQKPCIVISPLISLMQDQVMALTAKGVKACYLGSAQNNPQVVTDAWQGQYSFIYLTPELAVRSVERLITLRDSKGLCLVAVDEAHAISEWGFDFRPEYRQLGELRLKLQGVPFLALTATATPRVQNDIVQNLNFSQFAKRFVDSFERPNLHFEVEKKEANILKNLEALIKVPESGRIPSTIIYTISRREAEDLSTSLARVPKFAGKVGVYHGDCSAGERKRVHAAFLRDELSIVVATLAFGMGIDKADVRNVIHFGMPASLEAYYQQAGRAGRDGLPSRCTLLWTQADASLHATIKGAATMPPVAAQAFNNGMSRMLEYCTTGGCRHAIMVNYFAPYSFIGTRADGGCAGGCDNCNRKAAVAAGGGAADPNQRDLGKEAGLLLAILHNLGGYFGLGKALAIIKGSRSKDMKDHWYHLRHPDGTLLHGSGAKQGEPWWKGMADLLMSNGLAAVETRNGNGLVKRSYTVVVATPEGRAFMQAPRPLMLTPTKQMLESEKQQEAAEAYLKQRDAAVHAMHNPPMNAAREEEQKLFLQLQQLRQRLAAEVDLAPFMILSDAALMEISRKRPENSAQLLACEGCGAAFAERWGQRFIYAVIDFCRGNPALSAGIPWRAAKTATGLERQKNGLLSEPKQAGLEAYNRFFGGESLVSIATKGRVKPIGLMTVAGYLADAAGGGMAIDWERLFQESALTAPLADSIAQGIQEHGESGGLGNVKRAVPEAEYGQIKVVASMMQCNVNWSSINGAKLQEQQQQQHQEQVGESPAVPSQVENVNENAHARPTIASMFRSKAKKIEEQQQQQQQPMKKQRLDDHDSPSAGAAITNETVVAWLQQNGTSTAVAIKQHFCGPQPTFEKTNTLQSVLHALVSNFTVYRKGGSSGRTSEISMDDQETMFMIL